ncbi:MAG: hypothetical protein IKB93_07435 [Clostridia bacterium]|nr:hypothetical protein [Clostridia bacterium]
MVDKTKYIINGKVQRTKISSDVRYGILSIEDIKTLSKEPEIIEGYIGNDITKKQKKEWTKDYLDQLVCMSVAECFNLNYLMHIKEVSDYLNEKKKLSAKIKIGIGIAVVAAITIVFFTIRR